jgi:predicted TIM-barrel fold metal-dependent hydrolase
MKRRDFIVGSTALSATSLPSVKAFGQALASLPPLIDAHCHVFNATDLPMVAFIEKVVLAYGNFIPPEYRKYTREYSETIDYFLRYLAGRLRARSKIVEDELDRLSKIEKDENARRAPEDIEKDEIAFITEVIEDLKSKRVLGRRPGFIVARAPHIIVGLIHRETFPTRYNVKGYKLGDILNNADGAYTPDEWQPSPELAKQLYKNAQGDISFYIKWGCFLLRYRHEIVAQLQAFHHNRAILLTPALVDYNKWLDLDESNPVTRTTPMEQQVEVMARISRQKFVIGRPRVHGFVAFDPARQAMHREMKLPSDKSPLTIVQDAIENKGFIGVKLYPPMGFRASNNIQAGDDFPCAIRFGRGSAGYDPICNDPTNAPDKLGNEPGKKLDAALHELFAWCAKREVPIMAHTNNSNDAGPGYGTRANPKYWLPIIEEFRNLRVNLAHFGSFNEAIDDDGEVHEDKFGETWESGVAQIWAKYPDCKVYADLSYLSEVLNEAACAPSKNCGYNVIKKFLARFVKDFDPAKKRLIYGSDWLMTGIERKFPASTEKQLYVDLVQKIAVEIGLNADDFFRNNSADFLGLRASDSANGNRGRLEKFYTDAGIDPSWMKVF